LALTVLHLDLETRSTVDLKSCGLYKYAEDDSTGLTLAAFAFDDQPVELWLPWDDVPLDVELALSHLRLHIGTQCPEAVAAHIRSGGIISAHNAQFERVVLGGTVGRKHGVPPPAIEQMRCTMAKAAVHGLPQALEHAAAALGTHPKDKDGANDMRYLAKPRKDGTWPTPHDEPERFINTALYCVDDVEAERDIDRAVPDLSEREQSIYFFDQRVNDRGWAVDQRAVHDAIAIRDAYKARLAKKCLALTGVKPTQTGEIAAWIRENGYPQLPNLQAPSVNEAVKDPACPPKCVEVLRTYSTYAMKAVSKFDAMLKAVCKDGRLHGMFQYYGAGTGRWSSRIVQLQNMARGIEGFDADAAIKEFEHQDVDMLDLLYDHNPMRVLASCTRGMLTAGEGCELLAYDFSAIEARIVAWLADEQWKLEVFRTHGKIYEATAALMFGVPMESVTKESKERLGGKIGDLACGYQGGAGAVEKMARQMDIALPIPSDEIVAKWRAASPKTKALWYDLEAAAREAVSSPGKAFAIPNKRIMFKTVGQWLYMRLPSGRRLAYYKPEVDDGRLSYMGTDTYTRRWMRVETYGGRLLQNAGEGIARDLLVNGLLRMEEAGYPAIGSIHDEGVFEVPEGFGSEDEARSLMTTPLKWAEGLPVACSGYRAKRYRK
jgi:DNA polymerase